MENSEAAQDICIKMAQALGAPCPIFGEDEEWVIYKEKLTNYFTSNEIKEEVKSAILLNAIGSKAYKVIRDLCNPDVPSTKTFDDLTKLMDAFYTPPVCIFNERKLFFDAKKFDNESAAQWAVRLKALAGNCKFGNSLELFLLNKFVTGMEGRTFEKLCEEDEKLTWTKAQEIAARNLGNLQTTATVT